MNLPSLKGKICLITGATDGIGLVTARALAQTGATTVIVGRNAQKTAAAVESIRAQSGNPNVESLLADLSVQAQVRQLAADFTARHDRLHVLVNNAGAYFAERSESVDGIEMTFALNHLNYFLLTNLLMPTLKASAPARVVNVSSGAHTGGKINFDDLQGREKFRGWSAYANSKLANVMFTYELARRLEGTGVTANVLHPGFVATRFGQNNPGMMGSIFKWAQKIFALTPEKGAETSIYLATSPEVEGITGKYFDKKKIVASSPASYDEDAARRLWEISAQMTGLA